MKSSIYKIRAKFWSINSEEKRAPIPPIIWSDGHSEGSRWYWMKDKYEHMGRGQYFF